MSRIQLESPTYEIITVNRKTSAATMKDWQPGDRVRFSTVMKAMCGASGGGVYASDYTAENLTNGTSVTKSQTQLSAFFDLGNERRPSTFSLREVSV
jgi:hypothetical protein